MLANLYFWTTLIIIIETCFYFGTSKTMMNKNHCTLFFSAITSSGGFFIMSTHSDIDSVLIGNGIYYIGALSTAIYLFLTIAEICEFKLPKWFPGLLIIIDVIILHFVFTCKTSTAYYSSIDVEMYKGIYYLHKVRGPAYILTPLLVIGCSVMALCVAIYSYRRKKNISYKSLYILLAAQIVPTIIYVVQRLLKMPLDLTPVSYVIMLFLLLYIFRRSDLYDMSMNMANVSKEQGGYGYICFDMNMRFMSCNKFAAELIPELNDLQIDRQVDFCSSKMFGEILTWLEEWTPKDNGRRHFSEGDKYLIASIRNITLENRPCGFLVEIIDDTNEQKHIHELKNQKILAELAKKEAQDQAKTKSGMISILTHEIRNPLNAIVGTSELLLRESDSFTPKQIELITNIKDSGQAQAMIIDDILDLSLLEEGLLTIESNAYEIRPLLEQIVYIANTQRINEAVKIEYECDDKVGRVLFGAEKRVGQILVNLLNNAARTAESGKIKLLVTVNDERDFAGTMKQQLSFEIVDSNTYFDDEKLKQMLQDFRAYKSSKDYVIDRSTLCLALSNDLVKLMGGKLEVLSDIQEGTRYSFSLYQTIHTDHEATKCEDERDAILINTDFTLDNVSTLVVDDMVINLAIAQELLKPLNMQIDTAQSGEIAIEMVKKKKYDLVLMDFMMPYMDGAETTKNIRELANQTKVDGSDFEPSYFKELPIIALSGDSSEQTKYKFEMAGVSDFCTKPIEIKQIKRAMLKCIPEELIHIAK